MGAQDATTQRLLLAGLAGSLVVGLGEHLLHFHPDGPAGEIDMLLRVPLERARIGHFLSLVGIPLYFLGYLGCFRLFSPSAEKTAAALLSAGILSFLYGGIWISSRYFAASVLQHTAGTSLYEIFYVAYESNYQVLVWVLRILVLLVSALYVLCIWWDKTGLPKRLALLNPITVLVLVISTLVWARPIGIYVAPIAMNTTHFVFFASLLLAVRARFRECR